MICVTSESQSLLGENMTERDTFTLREIWLFVRDLFTLREIKCNMGDVFTLREKRSFVRNLFTLRETHSFWERYIHFERGSFV